MPPMNPAHCNKIILLVQEIVSTAEPFREALNNSHDGYIEVHWVRYCAEALELLNDPKARGSASKVDCRPSGPSAQLGRLDRLRPL
jgi:hypothetical protein